MSPRPSSRARGAEGPPATSPAPRVSVVIATYQRAHALPPLIEALERQTFPAGDFEVIVCDDSSTDGTAETLAAIAARTPLDLRVLRTERNSGPGASRNLGVRHARAPIVAFTDDDCLPMPGWLEAGTRVMGEARRLVIGAVQPNPDELARRGAFSHTIAVANAKAHSLATCNAFYRRDDFDAAGGFDESFTHGGEDTDLGLRVLESGTELAFAADALVYHAVTPSNFFRAARKALGWSDVPGIVAKHPDARHRLYQGWYWREPHGKVLLAVAGIALAPLMPRWLAAVPLGLAAPWVHYRTRVEPLVGGPRRKWAVLPGALVVDFLEVVAMARGSVRHRTFLL